MKPLNFKQSTLAPVVDNYMQLKVKAAPENEGFIRSAVGAFCVNLNPTLEEINDIKTAVSEAVTNSIVHGYEGKEGDLIVEVAIVQNFVHIAVTDFGVGIPDVKKAMEPFFTTKPDQDRSGMGFTVMQAFMDEVNVESNGGGVTVCMTKAVGEAGVGAKG